MQIRTPHPHERRTWRMLLPEAAGHVDPCDVLVAVAPLPDSFDKILRVIGAVAATRTQIQVPLRGPRVCLHVIPPFRRRGIGRAMIDAMSAFQLRTGATVLHAWSLLSDASPESKAWRSLDFAPSSRLIEQDMVLQPLEARLAPVYEQMDRADRIPKTARLLGLGETQADHLNQIAQLYVRELGGTIAEVQTRLMRRDSGGYHPELSVVVLIEERVIAFLLAPQSMDGDACVVEAVVVDPAFRGRWANVWVKLECARRGLRKGIRLIRFQTFDHNRETRLFTEKLGATTTRELWQFSRAIERA